ncbi:MAG: hypothetical protein WDO74_08480 [Pseudomonadota bacterium]
MAVSIAERRHSFSFEEAVLVEGPCILMALPGRLKADCKTVIRRFKSGPHHRESNMNGF